jgi:hypothetical protein
MGGLLPLRKMRQLRKLYPPVGEKTGSIDFIVHAIYWRFYFLNENSIAFCLQ